MKQLYLHAPAGGGTENVLLGPRGDDGRSWYVIHSLALADRPLEVETIATRLASLEAEREEVVYSKERLVRVTAEM